MNFDELRAILDKVDLSLGTPVDYSVPNRQFVFFHVFSDEPLDLYRTHAHWFINTKFEGLARWGDIIHGHSSVEVCATPHFCHVFGYKPKDTDNPKFRRLFNEKWKELYT